MEEKGFTDPGPPDIYLFMAPNLLNMHLSYVPSFVTPDPHQQQSPLLIYYAWKIMLANNLRYKGPKAGQCPRSVFFPIDSQCEFSNMMMCNTIDAPHHVMPIKVTIQFNLRVHQSRIGKVGGIGWKRVWWPSLSFTETPVIELLYVIYLIGHISHWKAQRQSLDHRHNHTVIRKQKQGGRGDRHKWRLFVSFLSVYVNGGFGKLIGEDCDKSDWQWFRISLNLCVTIRKEGIVLSISKLKGWHTNSQLSYLSMIVIYTTLDCCGTFTSSNQNLIPWQGLCVVELILITGIHVTESKIMNGNYVTFYSQGWTFSLNTIEQRHYFHHLMQSFLTTHKLITLLAFCFIITMSTNNSSQNSPDLFECCLIGKLLSNKPIRFQAMRTRLGCLWQPDKQVDITRMDTNRFMFQFFSQGEMECIYQTGPWLFDNFMLVTRKVSFGENPTVMPLDKAEIWVQLHNLPFGFMTETIGFLIGNHVGRFVKYDFENNCGTWRKFMRIKVEIDVNEPLEQSWLFERESAEAVTVEFKYERLGDFCYVCGILGHTHNFCTKKFAGGAEGGVKR